MQKSKTVSIKQNDFPSAFFSYSTPRRGSFCKHALHTRFRIHIHFMRIRIQPNTSMRIRIQAQIKSALYIYSSTLLISNKYCKSYNNISDLLYLSDINIADIRLIRYLIFRSERQVPYLPQERPESCH